MVRVRGDRYINTIRKKVNTGGKENGKKPLISQFSLGSMLLTVISDEQTETVGRSVCVCARVTWDE